MAAPARVEHLAAGKRHDFTINQPPPTCYHAHAPVRWTEWRCLAGDGSVERVALLGGGRFSGASGAA